MKHDFPFPSAKRRFARASAVRWERRRGAVLAAGPRWPTGCIPTLAPLVREVTPAVVNISVQGKVREDNPLYKDPVFREYFDLPKQLERR